MNLACGTGFRLPYLYVLWQCQICPKKSASRRFLVNPQTCPELLSFTYSTYLRYVTLEAKSNTGVTGSHIVTYKYKESACHACDVAHSSTNEKDEEEMSQIRCQYSQKPSWLISRIPQRLVSIIQISSIGTPVRDSYDVCQFVILDPAP